MRLNRKIVAFIIGILLISLLINLVMTAQNFRTNYTNALLSGSFGIAHSIESLANEMLALGLPLDSLSGMDKKLAEVVENNPNIVYAGIANQQGRTLFHSNVSLVGKVFNDRAAKNSIAADKPFWQLHDRFDGKQYYDITIPLFNPDGQAIGHIRMGFETAIVDDGVLEAVGQTIVIAILTFIGIGLLLNLFLSRLIISPIRQLSNFARAIAKGDFRQSLQFSSRDEIGELSLSLQEMSDTLRKQIDALHRSELELEAKVESRTHELAETNHILGNSNRELQEALDRERGLSEALRRSEERFRMLFEHNKAVMLIIDPDNTRIVAANQSAEAYYGYSHQQLLQMSMSDINTLSTAEIRREMAQAQQEKRNQFFFSHALASGEIRDVEVHSGPLEWEGRTLLYSIIHDVTDRKQAESKLEQMAHYDALTGLPNRLLKADRLQQAIAVSHRSETRVAVCYLDLDGFKPINDKYGHEAGDHLLIEIARRLQMTVREGDTVSRIGGDEFALILTDLDDSDDEYRLILERVLDTVSTPIAIKGNNVTVSASIGLTLYPDDDADPDILLRHADQAMYVAKNQGKNRYHLFNQDKDKLTKSHQEELQRIRQAFDQDELLLYYQPKINLSTGEVIGVEGLIRWNHPQQGILPPGSFLHLLNGTELEIELDRWVINHALQQLQAWNRQNLPLSLSINVSANHLQHTGFTDHLTQAIAAYPGAKPTLLEMEILETASIDDTSQILPTLFNCRELGIHFSLDDFGTGYSSLAYFHQLPMDNLKIDQGFVRDMLEDPQDLAIVDSVIRLANAFQNPVIAEGVETMDHAAALLRLGCHMGQGYGIARPMPESKLVPWLEEWRHSLNWQEVLHRMDHFSDIDWLVAKNSHTKWVETIIAQLDKGTPTSSVPLDSRHCAFGRWFHGGGYHRYGHLDSYHRLHQHHEQIHQLVQELSRQTGSAGPRIPELQALHEEFTDMISRFSS